MRRASRGTVASRNPISREYNSLHLQPVDSPEAVAEHPEGSVLNAGLLEMSVISMRSPNRIMAQIVFLRIAPAKGHHHQTPPCIECQTSASLHPRKARAWGSLGTHAASQDRMTLKPNVTTLSFHDFHQFQLRQRCFKGYLVHWHSAL